MIRYTTTTTTHRNPDGTTTQTVTRRRHPGWFTWTIYALLLLACILHGGWALIIACVFLGITVLGLYHTRKHPPT